MSKNAVTAKSGGRAGFAARFMGFSLMVMASIAFMAGSRPGEPGQAPKTSVANEVGAGLGALGVTGFVAARAFERRARAHEAAASEARAQGGAPRSV
ncbi:MAG: hypothetical protein JNL82_05875 [Myxococcales bacterium]|nr:hypothetical protein [Myxococcales bacterium]